MPKGSGQPKGRYLGGREGRTRPKGRRGRLPSAARQAAGLRCPYAARRAGGGRPGAERFPPAYRGAHEDRIRAEQARVQAELERLAGKDGGW